MRPSPRSLLTLTLPALVLAIALPAIAAPPQMPDEGVQKRPDRTAGGRVPFSGDSIALAIARGDLAPPRAGEDGWEAVERAENGAYRVRGGMYAAFMVQADEPATMLLKASGHGMVYVNGEPRPGDPYGYGNLQLPVRLEAGQNILLFQHGRGALRAELLVPPADVFIQEADVTAPDFLLGSDETLPLGAVVVNATDEPVTAAPWTSTGEEGEHARIEGAEMTVPAMSVRKVVFPVHYDGRDGETMRVTLGFGEHEGATRQVELSIKGPGQMYKRTFLSRIDGSCQYYAVQPKIPGAGGTAGGERPALVLSLHGASVEATNQANAYAPKTWCDIVCPTNRRPFGFDWEDWGRIDAMEVLDDAMRHLDSDPSRVYLTGHSMGGHGTWAIGTLYPYRFAAIAPSAGWLSFGTYTGARHPQLFEHTDGVAGIFARAARISDTEQRLSNLKGKGIYILHGDADDNVPVREARDIATKLTELGIAFESHEQAGAGHWWESSDEPGAECVDWPAMFDMFARHRLPVEDEVRTVEFVTTNVGVSSQNEWVTIYAQTDPGKPSRVSLRVDPQRRRVEGTTQNVALLTLDPNILPPGPSPVPTTRPTARASFSAGGLTIDEVRGFETLVLDGQTVQLPFPNGAVGFMEGGRQVPVQFHRDGENGWHIPSSMCEPPAETPERTGPFKHAFDNRVVFVYGTKGTPEETTWARAKARYDAESFYYRGNGSIAVVADVDFDPQLDPDHSVILYGNADTHEDWTALLGEAPVELRRGHVKVGDVFTHDGEDRGIVFCYPRAGSERALVGVVGGTGLVGMKLTDRLPYFTSGVHYPDWTVFGPAVYESGYEAADAAGYFNNAWQADPDNSAVREE